MSNDIILTCVPLEMLKKNIYFCLYNYFYDYIELFYVLWADWAAVATISIRKDVETFPVANLISISDGPTGNGTGIPYMYLTPLDYTAQDLVVSKHHIHI